MTTGHDADRPALTLFAAELRAARQHAGLTRDELSAKVNYLRPGTRYSVRPFEHERR